jgi:alpha,alpha-trehalose-phosphate synthase [UDP-forming]
MLHGTNSRFNSSSLRIDHLDEQSETSSSFLSRSQSFNELRQQGLDGSSEQQNGDNPLFVIDPNTNSWRFGNRGRSGGSGVVQSVEEQELLSSIQDLQRQLMEVRDEKEAWIEEDKLDSERLEAGDSNDARTSGVAIDDTKATRVVVVSNRLPVSVQKTTKGGRDVWSFEKTSGGLVSALRSAKEELDFLWVGWVGCHIPEEDRASVRQTLISDHGCIPIFLDKNIVNGYYHGFSNDILWPLFHYEPLPCFRPGQEKKFDVKQWDAYRRANDIFANAVNDILEDNDVCWIHDYHLMLVPRILRRLNPKIPIGFFLHVPFPSSDIYRMLPVRRKILEGVLASDLVGFHTYDYMRHFLSSASRILGLESSPKGITTKSGHFCSLGVFPIGIEPKFFQNVLERQSCQRRVAELCKRLGKVHILIGVDRLDYIKGMPHKLLAYEHLLKTRPEYRGNIVLIQVGVPSRVQVKEYQKLASQVNELVGRINGSFGTLDYTPIHYIQRPVSTEELCALYNVADACVITSIRDGMNLVR